MRRELEDYEISYVDRMKIPYVDKKTLLQKMKMNRTALIPIEIKMIHCGTLRPQWIVPKPAVFGDAKDILSKVKTFLV